MERIVYSDNAATTPISKNVYEAMIPYLTDRYGNPSSLYARGREEKKAVDQARIYTAEIINADPSEIIFTSGGSEADNLAIKGLLFSRQLPKNKKHIITSKIEHHAILHTCEFLERIGYTVTYLDVDNQGHIDLEQLENAITDDTALVSVMAANNEIGTIQDLKAIADICHKKGTLFHTDAVQAVGHMKLDVKEMGIDMLSMASHKVRGPKGVGALYCRKGIILEPLIHGGGQERGLRSGTENVAGIVGFGEALRYAKENMDEYLPYVKSLTDHLIEEVTKIPYTQLTGDPVNRLPGTASFVIECIEGESLILLLDLNGIATSTGSACSTGSLDPSHVLMSIGLPHEIAHGSLRVTLGEQNTMEDVDYIIEKINAVVTRLRDMSPVWEEKMNGQPSLKLFDK
ncbi:MAG: cysteine desulfurase NifS [Clostridiales bacterium]|nr:cysteine desulfurase NifS [Clostridiales bacterium]